MREPQLFLDRNGKFYPEATVFIMTGEGIESLYHVFHSTVVTFIFKRFYAGGGLGEEGNRYKKAFFERLPIPKVIKDLNVDEVSIEQNMNELYRFTQKEIDYIISQQVL